jgi:hypothetical protein
MRKTTAITGAAGAYFVLAELSQLGWAASPTWGNAPRTDVLAQRADGARIIAIQVKTRLSGSFHIGQKGETPSAQRSNEWFVLVSLHGPGQRPDFYVVPRNHIAALVYCGFRAGFTHRAAVGSRISRRRCGPSKGARSSRIAKGGTFSNTTQTQLRG